jgi:hypothetical protein
MIEWQCGSMFITVANPVDDNISSVSVFKYKGRESNWTQNESIWETAWAQDKAQAEILTEFTNYNLEPQKEHYREFLRK